MKKKLLFAVALVMSVTFSVCSCEEDDKSSSSISAYVDEAMKNSSQFSESRTMEEELYMRYTHSDIDACKKAMLEDFFAEKCDDLTDTDGDGLIDVVEPDAQTDINNPDTDGDGVDDFCEIYLLGSNPIVADE